MPPPDELVLLELELVLLELELLEVLEPQLPGGGWHAWRLVLHHQPPQQPLAWQGFPAITQPVQPACTAGPTSTPQVSGGPPLDEVVAPLEVVAPPLDEVGPAPVLLVLVAAEPQTLVTGMHTLAGAPSIVETAVQA